MMNFCTRFDQYFLTRGVALYKSLKRHCNDFHIYIYAFDNKTFDVLNKMNFDNATILSSSEFEDEKLLEIKKERTTTEYLWTCTPTIILHSIKKFNLTNCTFLDPDLYFYSSPQDLFDEFGKNSILITSHRYTPKYDQSEACGKYNVQFTTFLNNSNGMEALDWWKKSCDQWCYMRQEDNKFGDQKYLDDWTERFEDVHVLKHLGGGVAPWNIQQYHFFKKDGKLMGLEILNKKEFEIIFYHFHSLKYLNNFKVDLGSYKLSYEVIRLIYKPYLSHLTAIDKKIKKIDNSIYPYKENKLCFNLKSELKLIKRNLKRRINGNYNICSIKKLEI